MSIIESQLNEAEKCLQEFKDGVEDELARYETGTESIGTFDKDTFEWVRKSESEVRDEFRLELQHACQQLVHGGKLSLETTPDLTSFMESVGGIADELEILSDINETLRQAKVKARDIGKKLQAWEAK
ncbi:MAG: hypothetical protein HYX84_04905 [Chloroflexi bacterium]|nr:hypothetical protein [Chloroflexota bacterium]